MIVPRYWSEASHLERLAGRRQVTVRRFGWSSESQEAADAHARQRIEEAVDELRRGGEAGLRSFTRRERRVAYNGADGLPIREEIVEEREHAGVVVTRNSYGALCLNTPRAMFVDVDRSEGPGLEGCCLGVVAGTIAGAVVCAYLRTGFLLAAAAAVSGAIVLGWLGGAVGRLRWATKPRNRDLVAWARARLEAWCAERPGWLAVLYETPAGVRLLVLHDEFDADAPEAREFMEHMGVDPVYSRMCRLQNCFLARVSPKPWRAGIRDKFYPGGVWPVTDPEKLARRRAWIEQYEREAPRYASCRYIADVGTGRADRGVEEVRRIHDEMSRALQPLALA